MFKNCTVSGETLAPQSFTRVIQESTKHFTK